jgi:hypothetical protein|tara:strand:+ start:1669 stop:2007 length:339 start_codon:yes stop_codon:yes gene_type:complete
MKIGLLDNETVPNAPTSKFLTKEEIQKFDTEWIWNRQSFIFKHKIPLMVERKAAEVLVNKYDSVQYYEKADDYSKAKYNDLKKIATSKGIPYKETFIKKEELIEKIIELDGR